MEPMNNGEIKVLAATKTSDCLRFRLVRTSHGRSIQFNKEDVARVMSEFGSSDPDFVWPLLHRIGNMGVKDKIWEPDIIKSAISFVRRIRPRDHVSALLGLHMMIVNEAIMVNHGRTKVARVLQNHDEEEDAQRAVKRLIQTLIKLVNEFDRHQNRGGQNFVGANGHKLAKASERPRLSAPAAARVVEETNIGDAHRAAISDTREGGRVRRTEAIEDRESAGATVDIKTSDGLKFKAFQTNGEDYVNIDEHVAVRDMARYGSSDSDFAILHIRRIAELGINAREFDPDSGKLALALVRSLQPQDEIGALLAFHMAAVSEAMSFNFTRVKQTRFMQYNVEEGNADRAVNWSAQMFIALEQAFEQHQNGGEQKLTVRHVTAENGHRQVKTSKRPKRRIGNVKYSEWRCK
jgi:hypothetical protein